MNTIRDIMLRELKDGTDIDFNRQKKILFSLWKNKFDGGLRWSIGNKIYINICSRIVHNVERDCERL